MPLYDDLPLGTKPVDPRGDLIEGAGVRRHHTGASARFQNGTEATTRWSAGHSRWVLARTVATKAITPSTTTTTQPIPTSNDPS